jgi:hypothetical protein
MWDPQRLTSLLVSMAYWGDSFICLCSHSSYSHDQWNSAKHTGSVVMIFTTIREVLGSIPGRDIRINPCSIGRPFRHSFFSLGLTQVITCLPLSQDSLVTHWAIRNKALQFERNIATLWTVIQLALSEWGMSVTHSVSKYCVIRAVGYVVTA